MCFLHAHCMAVMPSRATGALLCAWGSNCSVRSLSSLRLWCKFVQAVLCRAGIRV